MLDLYAKPMKKPDSHRLLLDGMEIPIIIHKHRKSKRMVLRYLPANRSVKLTLPRYVSIRQGLDFVASKQAWVLRQMNAIAERNDGKILLRGKAYALSLVGGRGVVRIEEDVMVVPGDEAFAMRRLKDFLKAQAREDIAPFAREMAEKLGKKITSLKLRDMSSRWGSCNSDGGLAFCWRLVLAPPEVLRYVVCHEVAHLAHMDHSPRFWKIVEQLCPEYETHRAWLRHYGETLALSPVTAGHRP